MMPFLKYRRSLLLFFILFTLAWFLTLDYRYLIGTDEGRYAEMAREMFVTCDWITTRYNGYKYFEKPPLQTWMTAISFTLFGIGEWQARLWTAISGFAGIILIGFTGTKIFNIKTGLASALILASAPYWNIMGHFNSLDMGLAFMMTLSLCALLLAQRPDIKYFEQRNWMFLCWAAMALAVLSKGLIGIVLPGTVLIIYSLLGRDFAIWRRLHIIGGLIIFLAITAPWFIAVQRANPEFFDFFFINEHFRRFLKTDHHRTGAPWYFVPVLLIGFLPWLLLIPQSLKQVKYFPAFSNGFRPTILLTVWIIFIFIFFSVSQSKLISYALPIAPAIALVLGLALAQIQYHRLKIIFLSSLIILVISLAAVPMLYAMGSEGTPQVFYRAYGNWVYIGLALGILGSALALWINRWQPKRAEVAQSMGYLALIIYATTWFIIISLVGNAHNIFGRASSGALIAPIVTAKLKQTPAAPFYSIGILDHTFSFYTQSTMIMVAVQSELAFGIKQEPNKWIASIDEWKKTWLSQSQAFALMSPKTFIELNHQQFPMQVIARDERRVVVARR